MSATHKPSERGFERMICRDEGKSEREENTGISLPLWKFSYEVIP